MSESGKCDVCGRIDESRIVAGRWLFYCSDKPSCKEKDYEKTFDNEIEPILNDGDFENIDRELAEIILNNLT